MLNKIKDNGKANLEILSIGVESTESIPLTHSTALALFRTFKEPEGEDCFDAFLIEFLLDERVPTSYNEEKEGNI